MIEIEPMRMKIELKITLELPDIFNNHDYGELRQLLFDEYVNHCTCAHLETALECCVKGKIGTDEEDPIEKNDFDWHNIWADVCKKAKFELTEINDIKKAQL